MTKVLTISLAALALATQLAGCTADPGPNDPGADPQTPSASASATPEVVRNYQFEPGGQSFADAAANNPGLSDEATGTLLLDSEGSGAATLGIDPQLESFRLRLIIFCDEDVEYRIDLLKNGEFESFTSGTRCSDISSGFYLTPPVSRDGASFEVQVTVPEDTAYRIVTYEDAPDATK